MSHPYFWSFQREQHEEAKERYKLEAEAFLSTVRRPPTGRVLEAKP